MSSVAPRQSFRFMLKAFLLTPSRTPRPFANVTNPGSFSIPARALRISRILAMADTSPSHKHANRLASEHSPYLLQHAHNPVDWYPWGEEAFAEARARNVPIFLSIHVIDGFGDTCASHHDRSRCHVMEVESFESEEIAKLLNDWFVSIKVDREERPDVDRVYMTYVQALHGGGGWPLSLFLSPDLKPLMGGTYFPPDDKYGRPGFKTVLRRVKDAWDAKREALLKSGNFAIEQLSEALSSAASSKKLQEGASQAGLKHCYQQLAGTYDEDFGGFGPAPKFPRPVEIQFLLYQSAKLLKNGEEREANKALKMVSFTLQCMARGGIHDHIAGGFHRYSVDECWHVPHFEKMLYDQGQLVNVYLDTYILTKDPFYSIAARDILDYLKREMIGAQGEIFSAEDADSAVYEGASKKKEGAFYIWTSDEIENILGTAADIFKDHYYIKASGNCDLSTMSDPHDEFKGKNVLIERKDVPTMASKWQMPAAEYSSLLGACRKMLFEKRSNRPCPHLDDKVIVSWNGLAVSAFARASKILKTEPGDTKFNFPVVGNHPEEYLKIAERAVSFIKNKLYDERTHKLRRSYRNGPSKAPGFLDDYAFLIAGLLDLYEVSGRTCWLSWAIELQATQDTLFLDRSGGGYFNTTGEDPSVLLRLKEDHDGAEPSGNSVAAINLVRLSSIVSEEKSTSYRQTAEHLLALFESRLRDQPVAIPLMCCAADMLMVPSRKQVVLVGHKSCDEFEDMLVAAHASFQPNKTVIQIDPTNEEDMEFWEHNNQNIAQMAKSSPPDKVAAHVCQNFTCKAPVSDPKSLEALLNQN